MKRIDLSPNEKAWLKKRHKACNNGKERDRIKAILLYSEDWTVPMISQALRIHETTVNRHLNDYGGGKLMKWRQNITQKSKLSTKDFVKPESQRR